MSQNIRVMLVDDHEALRSGLQRLLEQRAGIEIVAEAESGEKAYQIISKVLPDVIVMDLNMPGMGGLGAIKHILARWSSMKIIVFSMHDEAAFAVQAISAGAHGYVTKSDDTNELVEAIKEVHHRKANFISRGMSQKVALHALARDNDSLSSLSAREFEIFRLLSEGVSLERIALMLMLSQKTVANHQTALKHKLGVSTPVELVRVAIKYGVIKG